MELSKLIQNCDIKTIVNEGNPEITGITLNSKQVEPGSMFIAYKGSNVDSHQFIQEALDKGASVIGVEEIPENVPDNVPIVQIENIRKNINLIADNFYNYPSRDLKMIAVTGTKGKTTTVAMIAAILKNAGFNVGTIGTLGIKYDDTYIEPVNTTPDSLVLRQTLRDMVDKGVEVVVMENSSQGFKQKRTDGIQYSYGVLLNIDRDHIGKNEHESFEDYVNCKLRLLDQTDKAIVNRSDKIWNYINPENQEKVVTFSQDENKADYYGENFNLMKKSGILGSSFFLNGDPNKVIELAMPGLYNDANALAAIAVCDQMGVGIDEIKSSLKDLKVTSRAALLPVARENGLTVLTDFAHNRLSAKRLLKDLRDYNPNKIICVFGVENFETKLRRYDLGLTNGKLADYTILTTATLGTDSFEEVNKEVIEGLKDSGGKYLVIPDRKEAYKAAMDLITEDDFLIIMNLFEAHSGGTKILDQETLSNYIQDYQQYLKLDESV